MAHPQPSQFETRTNATFEALMWALARPGQVRTLPEPGLTALIEALIDRECQVFAEAPAIATQAARTGAALVPMDRADHVFVNDLTNDTLPGRIALGSDLYPDEGATLIAPATLGKGPDLRLTGPGVDGTLTVRIEGPTVGFWTARHAAMRYPMGFELFLIDGDQVMGLPRSTEVEVL